MKKNIRQNLFLTAIFLLGIVFNNELKAAHIPGANITYTCNPASPLEYTFTLTLFRKCPGTHPGIMPAFNFTLTNSCGLINPVLPIFNQVGVPVDVNQLCASATSNCNGGTQPGIWKYTYEATITLPADCNGWNLAYELCCRDVSSNMTGAAGNDMAMSTTLNTLFSPCNNSPVITSAPIPYACINTNFSYCLTTYDIEGDSIDFSMVAPASNAQLPIAHLAGFTINQPLNNFVLNPLTGCITLNHANIGNYVVAILIREFDSNGNILSEIVHDFQIMVINCTNTPPVNPITGISNVSGTGSQTGPNGVSSCLGQNFCFDVTFEDLTDLGDNITIVTDALGLFPGSTFSQTGTNPVTGTFCWTAITGYTGTVATFIAQDDGCPVMGTSGFAVTIDIIQGVYAGPDVTICGAQSTQLNGTNSSAFTWSPATGLSCTNCASPIATPAVTTTYTVTGNLGGVCVNADQVTVNVQDIQVDLTPAGPLGLCTGDPALNLNAQLMVNGAAATAAAGGAGTSCYDQTIQFSNPALLNGTNNFNFPGTPAIAIGGTLTIRAYGDLDQATELWTIRDEVGADLGTCGGSLTQCGTTHTTVLTLSAAQINLWSANGSIDFSGVDVSGQINATLCAVGADFLEVRLEIDCLSGSGYSWSPGTGLTDPAIQNPIANPSATTTYTVSATYAGCTVTNTIDINVGTASTAPAMTPMPGTYCPNTTLVLNTSGGIAGTGSAINWYTGPNGTGTWMGTGSSLNITPTVSGENYYVRREGGCNTTGEDVVTINLKDYVYGLNAATTTTYCTDNAGWHHFFNNDEILLSIKGDLSNMPLNKPTILIRDDDAFYQQTQGPFTAPQCASSSLTPGEERFEMERNWNVNIGTGTLSGTYDVRFYYEPSERTDIETAAANWMAAYPACGYTYKYANPLGFYWFKNTGSNYTQPDYDGLHLGSTAGTTANGINYGELAGITTFSGGSGAIILEPIALLPVQWLSFEGETIDNKVHNLRWATETEQNSSHFNVQRSKDGITFESIGTKAAQGHSTTTYYYTFDDENPFEGQNYYRLELINGDGQVTYSNTILLVITADGLGYNFYPNPTNDIVFYQYETTEKENLRIEVLDVLGKLILSKKVASVVGMNNIPVDLSIFPSGTYMVRVHNEQSSAVHTVKVIKNKF